jgi:hypothetical protein
MKRRPRQEHALDVLKPDLLEEPLRRRRRVHAAEAMLVGEPDDERGERRSVPPAPVLRVDAQCAEDPDVAVLIEHRGADDDAAKLEDDAQSAPATEALIELGRREPRRREEHPHDLEVLLLGEAVDPSRRPLGQLHRARLGRRGRGERRRPRPPLAGCAPPLEVHVEERLGEHIDRLRSSTPQVGEALVDLRFVGGLVHGHDTSLDSAEQSSDGIRSWSC